MTTPLIDKISPAPEGLPGKRWYEGSKTISWDQMCFVRSLGDIDQLTIGTETGLPIAITTLTSTQGEHARMTTH